MCGDTYSTTFKVATHPVRGTTNVSVNTYPMLPPNLAKYCMPLKKEEEDETDDISGFIYSINHTPPIITLPEYCTEEDCKRQFVEPHNPHQVNAPNVQESKHLKIISSVDFALRIDWPLQLWNAVTEQTLITLNLLRTSRIDRTKSAYHQKSWVTNMIGMHIRYKERKKYHSV